MIEVKNSIFDFTRDEWNSYVPENHPFLKYEFYQALEESKCIGAEAGWIPFYLKNEQAILPIYLKNHSYGEFIFDWSWAQAYERTGIHYYPKLTAAIPHTPVSAPKFISKGVIDFTPFIKKVEELSKQYQCSSTHFLFTEALEAMALEEDKYSLRHSIQYHWHNDGYNNFDDFLATLRKDKRKNFKKERQSIAASNLKIVEKAGSDISQTDAYFMAKLYNTTIEKKWSQAYLNQDFFLRWFELLKEQMLFIVAYLDDAPVAAAIHLKSDSTIFGRYWGSFVDVPYLHFELCYYRAIEYAIRHKLKMVEGGAQGEHKLLRGFNPTIIKSHHKIEHPAFKKAIDDFLDQESRHISEVMPKLNHLTPYKRS